jgi:putative peptide zinc metalloprotease protein
VTAVAAAPGEGARAGGTPAGGDAPPEAAARHFPELDDPRRVDTSERHPVFLLAGKNGSRLRLSESAQKLLRLRGAGVSSEAIAEALARGGKAVSAAEVEARYRELLARIETIERASGDNPMGFWFRFRLLPEALVARLASFLALAFEPRAAAVLVLLAAVAGVRLAELRPAAEWSAASFWLGYVLLVVSVVAHELGHASACAYFGVRPSDIGATLYLIYPALYSDVSGAWRLPRRQRVVVDLGGMYFQLLCGGAYAAAYAVTGWQPFWVAILMILGSGVFSLNPIFKFDGYWVVADALGVTNLSRQPKRVLGHWWKRLRGRPSAPLPWSGGVASTLAVYSVLTIAVWAVFLWRLGPRIVAIVAGLPPQIAAFAAGEGEASLPSLLMSAFMAALTLYISVRMVRSMIVRPLYGAVRRLRAGRAAAAPLSTTAPPAAAGTTEVR